MKNRMELVKEEILNEESHSAAEKARALKEENEKRLLKDEKIEKFNSYIKSALKDCHDDNIRIMDNKNYGNIIAFQIGESEYYVRLEYESWEDRMSDESPIQTFSQYVLGLYPNGWGTKPKVSCDVSTNYYEYLDEKIFKYKLDDFVKSVYKFLAKKSLDYK